MPGVPRSSPFVSRNAWISFAPNAGFCCFTIAAAPATAGVDADVPVNPDWPHAVNAPYVADDWLSWPAMSGLTRPSIVGPRSAPDGRSDNGYVLIGRSVRAKPKARAVGVEPITQRRAD